MRVVIHILDAVLDTLQTISSRCHILGYKAEVYVEDVKYSHNISVLYMANSMY